MKYLLCLCTWLGLASVAPAHVHVYQATLTGGNEFVPNGSLGFGTSTITLDLDLITMQMEIQFTGLSGTTTEAFLHGVTLNPGTGTAGQMSPALSASGFPLGVTGGSYDHAFDLTVPSSYDPSFLPATPFPISDALNALAFGLEEGNVYLSIKTSAFPNGEIRGFFTEVPEPSTTFLLAISASALCVRRRPHSENSSLKSF